jgi:hypothetical protein
MADNHSDEKESGEGMQANDFDRERLNKSNYPSHCHHPKQDGIKEGD